MGESDGDRYRKLFGEVALEMGFVNASQLYEGLTAQQKRKTDGLPDKLLGQVLLELGHLDTDQIQKIIDELYPTRVDAEDDEDASTATG